MRASATTYPLFATCAILLFATPLRGQKTDVVVLENGDSITGELKELQRARLKFDTDASDNIFFEWRKIRGITAPGPFEIELESGALYFGGLETASPGRFRIVEFNRTVEVPLDSLVEITPIKATFWARLDGKIEFGLNYAKANRALNLNSTASVTYRGRAQQHQISASTYAQSRDDTEATSRLTFNGQTLRMLQDRWFVGAQGRVESNDELGLEIRTTVGVFLGRELQKTNHVDWYALTGLSWNRERFTDEETTSTTFEVPITTGLNLFLFGDHETSLEVRWTVLPSLTDFGRVRMDLDASFRRDLFSEFYMALSGYDSFDSRPPIDATKNDFGLSLSIGYDL